MSKIGRFSLINSIAGLLSSLCLASLDQYAYPHIQNQVTVLIDFSFALANNVFRYINEALAQRK